VIEPKMKDRLLSGCDDAQIAAITSEAAPLLVLAGAGSGKTRVLTRRIAWRIAQDTARSGHCLALTFTRKAAGELRQRLTGLGLTEPVLAGTFHAIALGELRRRALDAGRPAPALIDSKARLVTQVLESMTIRPERSRFVDRRELISLIAAEIEWAKARLVSPEDYARATALYDRRPDVDVETVTLAYTGYEREKKKKRLVDFEDLLLGVIDAINTDPAFAASQRWKFRHLFVDEYQDANPAQIALLQAWLGDRHDLFAVGDPKQAIYAWNGADPAAIESFSTRFAGAEVLELDTNYRSTPQVLAVASAVITSASRQPSATRDDGPLPQITTYDSDEAEAAGIASALRSAHRRGRSWADCAVLTRTNAQLDVIERALDDADIPRKTAGGHALFNDLGVKRAMATLERHSGAAAFCAWLDDLETDASLERRRGSEDEHVGEEHLLETGDLGAIDALVALGRDYLVYDPLPSGDGFMVFARQSLQRESAPGSIEGVELLTFHRAKGLEWPVVFVAGLEEGFVPIVRAKTRLALDEEERLLYVALSRAEDELHCSWATSRRFPSRVVAREPSRYLASIQTARQRLAASATSDGDAAREAIAASRATLERQRAR
jgi:DNA helicase-2/ATP-dependent DNA helicase PcrA